jgi:diadenosine tetraphosphate (Ap4A) HIT family hydrolase
MDGFVLHPRLAADTAFITDWTLSRLLLMNDRRFPWLILVPRQANLSELFDLEEWARNLLMREVAEAAHRLKLWVKADKINVAALGNQVPQLHVHVIARRVSDAAWPNPVWGVGNATPYPNAELDSLISELKSVLSAQ